MLTYFKIFELRWCVEVKISLDKEEGDLVSSYVSFITPILGKSLTIHFFMLKEVISKAVSSIITM